MSHWIENACFAVRSVQRSAMATSLLRNGHWDAHIAGMPQSGNHWLIYMLGLTIARLHDIPPPSHIESLEIIGQLRAPRIGHPNIPKIASSHATPNVLHRFRFLAEWLRQPKQVILVRNLLDAAVSEFERSRAKYDDDFALFLRKGRRHGSPMSMVWNRILFFNHWGDITARFPERTCVLKYEEMKQDTVGELARVCRFLGLEGADDELLAEVVAQSSKERMAELPNPPTAQGAIRHDSRPTEAWFSKQDYALVVAGIRNNLKHAFGYSY